MCKLEKKELKKIENLYLSSEDVRRSCIFIVILFLLCELIFYKTIKFTFNSTFNIIIISIVSIYEIFNRLIKRQLILKAFINQFLFPIIVVIVFLSFINQAGNNMFDRIKESMRKERTETSRINEEWKSKGYKCLEKQLFYETETKNIISLNKKCNF